MTLEDAKKLKKGDYVMSHRTACPYEPFRVTEHHVTPSEKFAFVRLHWLASALAMGGGGQTPRRSNAHPLASNGTASCCDGRSGARMDGTSSIGLHRHAR